MNGKKWNLSFFVNIRMIGTFLLKDIFAIILIANDQKV